MAIFRGVPPHQIGEHSDAALDGIADGEAIVWQESTGQFIPGTAGADAKDVKVRDSDAFPGFLLDKIVGVGDVTVQLGSGGLGDAVEISATSGETNTASNVGAGEGVFAQKAASDLQFKSVTDGEGVTVSSTATEVSVTSPVVNRGAGAKVADDAGGLNDRQYRTITAGQNISVTEAADEIEVAATGIAASDQVLVRSDADLPAPVDKDGVDTIILEGGKEYLQNNAISSPYPLAPPVGGGVCTWKTLNRSIWTYTGTEACFRDIDVNGRIELNGLTEFQAPNGAMFNIVAQAGGGFTLQCINGPRFQNCKEMGVVDGGPDGNGEFLLFFGTLQNFCDGLRIQNCFFSEVNTMFISGNNCAKLSYDAQTVAFTDGETVTGGSSGATGVVEIDRNFGTFGELVLSSVVGTFVDNEALTGSSTGVADVNGTLGNTTVIEHSGSATSGTINLIHTEYTNGANEDIFDIQSTAATGAQSINIISNAVAGPVLGAAFAPGSVDNNTPKAIVVNNSFIADTTPSVLLAFANGVVTTTIATVNTPVPLAGAFIEKKASIFSTNAAGLITYNGVRDLSGHVDMSFSLEGQGGADVFTVYLYKNGVAIADLAATFEASGIGDPVRITMIWEEDLAPGDTLQVWVENNTDSSDLIARSAAIRV